jgi:hypothetical protein
MKREIDVGDDLKYCAKNCACLKRPIPLCLIDQVYLEWDKIGGAIKTERCKKESLPSVPEKPDNCPERDK